VRLVELLSLNDYNIFMANVPLNNRKSSNVNSVGCDDQLLVA